MLDEIENSNDSGSQSSDSANSNAGPSNDSPPLKSEQEDRIDLANAFRLAEAFGFHEGICNHFSVRLDCEEERYLINPYGTHWSEMKPESLLLIDGEGTVLDGDGMVEDSAKFIHIGGHRANARHKALLHTQISGYLWRAGTFCRRR